MANNIELVFDKVITNLAGNRYGKEVYTEQIENKIDINQKNIIIFPIEIEDIASSFIEGIYKVLGERHGKINALDIMELQAKNEEAQEKIDNSIKTFGVF